MIHVFDDVLPDPLEYRRRSLARPFGDVTLGPDTFKGIATPPDQSLSERFEALCPGLSSVISFLRKSPEGQREPNYVHNDSDMGTSTGIYYMNPEPAEGDGTSFWAHDATNLVNGPWSKDLTGWRLLHTIDAKFNRLLVFPADLYHSRALLDNYGADDSSRLIQVVFAK